MRIDKSLQFLAISLLMINTACFKDIEIDIEEAENRLVLNGWFQSGKTPEVKVYASKGVFEPGGTKQLSDAQIQLFENDEFATELVYNDSGFYQSKEIILTPENTYRVEVSHPSYPAVSATVKMPAALNDNEVQMQHRISDGFTEFGYTYSGSSEITITLNDDGSEDNYYIFDVLYKNTFYQEFDNPDPDTTYTSFSYGGSLTSDNPTVEYFYLSFDGYLALSDQLFNGDNYTVILNSFSDLRFQEITQEDEYYNKNEYFVQVHNVSPALYRYMQSVENNQYPEPFTEPTQLFSNVEGGYGILGASSISSIPILEEYVQDNNSF